MEGTACPKRSPKHALVRETYTRTAVGIPSQGASKWVSCLNNRHRCNASASGRGTQERRHISHAKLQFIEITDRASVSRIGDRNGLR